MVAFIKNIEQTEGEYWQKRKITFFRKTKRAQIEDKQTKLLGLLAEERADRLMRSEMSEKMVAAVASWLEFARWRRYANLH